MKWLSVFLCLVLLSCADSDNTKTVVRIPPTSTVPVPVEKKDVNPYAPVDLSPMDMSYLPDDYPVLKMTNKTNKPPVARVIYSRPHRQGRKIFGALLKYGEPWRLGANEATELELFQPVTIQHKTIPKGKYVLYCIPNPDKWTIVFNGNLTSWGLKQDPSQDEYHFDIPVTVKDQSIEFFTMVFEQQPKGADLVMAWDNVEARLPIQYNSEK